MDAAAAAASPRLSPRWDLLLVLLAVLAFAPALGGTWIWDDAMNLEDCPAVADPGGLPAIWFEPTATQQWYPVTFTAFWIQHKVFGFSTAGFHAVNLLLHGLAALLLARLLRRCGFPAGAAWLAGALFAVHPAMAESACWVTEQRNTLSLALSLGAALLWARWAGWAEDGRGGEGSAGLWAGATLLGVAALLAKTSMVGLPPALLVLGWWRRGRVTGREALAVLPLLAAAVGTGIVTMLVDRDLRGEPGAEWILHPADRVEVAGRAAWFYARILAWPAGLLPVYPRWTTGGGVAAFLPAAAAAALPVALLLLRGRIGRGPAAAVLLFGGLLFPVLGFLDIAYFRYSLVADHFGYPAFPALLAPAALGLHRLGGRLEALRPGAARAGGAALLVLLGSLSVAHAAVYRNTRTLWTAVAEGNPRAWVAWLFLGAESLERGMVPEAAAFFRRSLEIFPEQPELWNNLGVCLLRIGRPAEALAAYRELEKRRPGWRVTHEGLGWCHRALGDGAAAEAAFRRAREIGR